MPPSPSPLPPALSEVADTIRRFAGEDAAARFVAEQVARRCGYDGPERRARRGRRREGRRTDLPS